MQNYLLQQDATLARLDQLAGQYVPSILRLNPPGVDRILDNLLADIGEALGTDQTVFAATDSLSTRPMREWTRPGSMACGIGITIPVSVGGRRIGVLSVGSRPDDQPYPSPIADRLRTLAELMALTVQCGERITARRQTFDASSALAALPADDCNDNSDFEDIIGDSPTLRIAITRVLEVAPTDASVVLLGETGTGKELFARAVHNRSHRRGRPFIRVNCAALPPTLIETELFGHERGAFTGAVAMRRGRFELADKGTLFLDEIGDLPVDVQAKLLRVLQEGEFERVGSSEPRQVDVRVVAATHHDLSAIVKEGRFRADLFYRLNVFPIALPPLRERPEDIPRLVWFFVNRRQRALNRKITRIPPGVFAALQQHTWPGNVRELENVIERLVVTVQGQSIELDHLSSEIRHQAVVSFRPRRERRKTVADELYKRMIDQHESFWTTVYPLFMDREITRNNVREVVRRGLEEARGNYKIVARLFNMESRDYKRFLNFLRKHDCQIPFKEYR